MVFFTVMLSVNIQQQNIILQLPVVSHFNHLCVKKLHDTNFRPVVWLWKPFHRLFIYVRRRWDSAACIHAQYFCFSLFKDLICIFHTTGGIYSAKLKRHVMYYDPSVQIDTPEFYMYAALAGCVLMLFVFFPIVLLILVPDETFYKLRLMSCISQVACSARLLNHFRDSTKTTRDYRVVSASFLIIRLVYIAILISGTASELCCVLFACTFTYTLL